MLQFFEDQVESLVPALEFPVAKLAASPELHFAQAERMAFQVFVDRLARERSQRLGEPAIGLLLIGDGIRRGLVPRPELECLAVAAPDQILDRPMVEDGRVAGNLLATLGKQSVLERGDRTRGRTDQDHGRRRLGLVISSGGPERQECREGQENQRSTDHEGPPRSSTLLSS